MKFRSVIIFSKFNIVRRAYAQQNSKYQNYGHQVDVEAAEFICNEVLGGREDTVRVTRIYNGKHHKPYYQ